MDILILCSVWAFFVCKCITKKNLHVQVAHVKSFFFSAKRLCRVSDRINNCTKNDWLCVDFTCHDVLLTLIVSSTNKHRSHLGIIKRIIYGRTFYHMFSLQSVKTTRSTDERIIRKNLTIENSAFDQSWLEGGMSTHSCTFFKSIHRKIRSSCAKHLNQTILVEDCYSCHRSSAGTRFLHKRRCFKLTNRSNGNHGHPAGRVRTCKLYRGLSFVRKKKTIARRASSSSSD